MKRVQIVGGSGFIGTNLIDILNNSYSVINIDKVPSKKYEHLTKTVDIRFKEELCNKLQPAEWLVLLAAEHRDDISPTSLYYDVNVNGIANIVATAKSKKINNIIFISTVAVYGLNKKNIDENCKENPFNDYGKSKFQAEKILKKWFKEDATNRTLIIIRPTVVFGPNNFGNVHTLLSQISSGKFLMVGDGKNKKSMAYVENVVGFIKFCMDKNFSGYHLYNYVDKPDFSMAELIDISEKSLQKKLMPFKIPYVVGYAGGLCFDALSFITKKKYAISSVRIKKFCASTQFSSLKMLETGYKPLYTLEEGLSKTIHSIKQA